MDPKQAKALAERIEKFLENHAKKDAEGENWNGPDPYELEAAAYHLNQGRKPKMPFSQWGSGCYHPYNDKAAQAEHDNILLAIKEITP